MNLKKKFNILLLMIMCLISLSGVSAYEVNDTLRINAEYRVGNVLTNSNASISIFLPSSLVSVNNVTMNNTGIGLFLYDYLIPDKEGEYSVHVDYYNKTTWLADEDSVFVVGDDNKLRWGECPSGSNGYFGMWIFFIILFAVGITGMLFGSIALTLISGGALIFLSLSLWNCGELISYVSLVLGIVVCIIAFTIKK